MAWHSYLPCRCHRGRQDKATDGLVDCVRKAIVGEPGHNVILLRLAVDPHSGDQAAVCIADVDVLIRRCRV